MVLAWSWLLSLSGLGHSCGFCSGLILTIFMILVLVWSWSWSQSWSCFQSKFGVDLGLRLALASDFLNSIRTNYICTVYFMIKL